MGQRHTTGRPSPNIWGSPADLFRSIRYAEKAQIITSDESAFLRDLCENIEFGLARPVSCLRVCEAQQLRDWSAEKFRRLRISLEEKRVIVNTMPANGWRGRFREDASGLDLYPLIERQEEFAAQAKSIHTELRVRREMVADIRALRGRISRALRQGAELPSKIAETWKSLPRRVSSLSVEALEMLLAKVEKLWKAMIQTATHPTNLGDASHTEERRITDTQQEKHLSKYASAQKSAPKTVSAENTMKEAMETLKMACEAEPEMLAMAEAYTQGQGVEGLVQFAMELAMLGGVPQNALLVARRRMSMGEFCGMCLLVWSKSSRNSDMPPALQIRNPAGWVWSMGAKAENGEANISASLKGLRKYWSGGRSPLRSGVFAV